MHSSDVDDVWFFERIAPVYDLFVPSATAGDLEAGLDQASGDLDRVLDLGGGTGRAIRSLDVADPIVLDAAQDMLDRVPAGIDGALADARRLPIRSGSLDAVLIVDAYHHLPDPMEVLEESERALRPGGVLLIREYDPTTIRGSLLERIESLVGLDSHFHSPDSLRNAVAHVGLEGSILQRGFGYTVLGRKPGP